MTSARSWAQALDLMRQRIDWTASRLDRGFPHFADPEGGTWTTTRDGDWTGGFWPALLWLTYAHTGDPTYCELAREGARGLQARVGSKTVFRGFLFYYGAALGALLANDREMEVLAIDAAQGLGRSFNPDAGVLPLGEEAEEASDIGVNETNVDGVSAVRLLTFAAVRAGEPRLREIGLENARRHVALCVRADGSVAQSATFDPRTGARLRSYSHKGYSDGSTWARAQAWAMLGFTQAAQSAEDPREFLKAARTVTDWWIENVPDDRVAFWDFDDPAIPSAPRDTSASAIAAAAMLKLDRLLGREVHGNYREEADVTAENLVAKHLTPLSSGEVRPPGMLVDGCYNNRIRLAVSSELIWGDYFLYESLLDLTGLLDSSTI